jgi:hypothetical protein
MGLGMRIFIVKDDDSLERLPAGRYNRLLQRDSNERLLPYAGKRVRCAVIVVESFERIPLEPLIVCKNKQVVDARHKFARKRYAREYLWQPSPEIEGAIWKAIFGQLEAGRS